MILGVNLLQSAVHQIGHSLGLHHSTVSGSVMAPNYAYQADFKLHSDDVQGIQFLYGETWMSRCTDTIIENIDLL